MSKRLRIILIAIFALIASVCALAGCAGSKPSYYYDSIEKGYNSTVTYYSNGGNFKDNINLVSVKLRYKSGATPMEITEDSKNLFTKLTNYMLDGWYYVELVDGVPQFKDAQGNAVEVAVDEKGDQIKDEGNEIQYRVVGDDSGTYLKQTSVFPVLTSEKVDFTTLQLVADSDIYIGAKWKEDIKLRYQLVCDIDITVGETTYKAGEIIKSESYTKENKIVLPTTPITFSDEDGVAPATFIAYYYDEKCEKQLETSTIYRPDVEGHTNNSLLDVDEKGNVTIYAKFLEGNWTLLKTPDNVKEMFSYGGTLMPTNKYYLFNDIDCTDLFTVTAKDTFECTIYGNNHTIKGLTFSATGIKNEETVSALGTITSTAVIKDLTFENMQVTFGAVGNCTLYALTDKIESGATIENFVIDGLTFTANVGGTLHTTSEDKFIIGGTAYATDDAYLASDDNKDEKGNKRITIQGEKNYTRQ